eukprot:TRINITY_DN2003_c0_g1_i1.p1 TRINITY_DN2003_c0_g1~~TRINITY_DN2003_c0_g1_i1.p1  ORF type:complete len:700 (-),score=119.86 TRINITY_DN2003_c0_g1_i1:61-2079(-)
MARVGSRKKFNIQSLMDADNSVLAIEELATPQDAVQMTNALLLAIESTATWFAWSNEVIQLCLDIKDTLTSVIKSTEKYSIDVWKILLNVQPLSPVTLLYNVLQYSLDGCMLKQHEHKKLNGSSEPKLLPNFGPNKKQRQAKVLRNLRIVHHYLTFTEEMMRNSFTSSAMTGKSQEEWDNGRSVIDSESTLKQEGALVGLTCIYQLYVPRFVKFPGLSRSDLEATMVAVNMTMKSQKPKSSPAKADDKGATKKTPMLKMPGSNVMKGISFVNNFMYYSVNKGGAKKEFAEMQHSVDPNTVAAVWRLPDTPTVSFFSKFSLPNVHVDQELQLRVPREVFENEPLYKDQLHQHVGAKDFTISARLLCAHRLPGIKNVDEDAANVFIGNAKYARAKEKTQGSQSSSSSDSLGTSSTESIGRPPRTTTAAKASTSDGSGVLGLKGGMLGLGLFANKKPVEVTDTLIIHFHGGGFISMSSFSHEDYTRKWTKLNNTPILSVDYRLAPVYPFPVPLLDCWWSYKWAVENASKVLGREIKRFVLTGDSAGGNLAAAVSLKAIQEGYRVPDGVVLSYPALDLAREVIYPSRLLALRDVVLPYAFLAVALDAYLPTDTKYDPHTNPLCSPIVASDELLRKFPPCYISVGNKDPLHDDSIVFASKLKRCVLSWTVLRLACSN